MDEMPHGLLPTELAIGHPEVDAQHDEIFCRIEALKNILLEDGRTHYAEFDALLDSFRTHFATEEAYARAAGVDFTAHAREHLKSLRIFSKAAIDLRGGRLDVRTFLRYLEYWFEQHINDFDKTLGHRLDEAGERSGRSFRPRTEIRLSA